MLDGLLGRNGFSSKCKSLIKPTRTRIAALRKREEAKQRFLKEDLAKLLANGLDVNAYGRTEEFIAGLNLFSCYTFIDQSCEYILKQLSVMQKVGQCPEECRETVASLMFAAARFSDLPELRELRDLFQDRYGNGLECYVNQVFVEKIASKPPVVEKRIKLLQDIATEFSIQWDSKGFKQRMDKPPTLAQKLSVNDDEYKPPNGDNGFRKNDQRPKERVEHAHQVPKLHNAEIRRKDVVDSPILRREEKHHKEIIEQHDNGNAYGRRKEVSDIPHVEINKNHGYKHERIATKEENGGYFPKGNPEKNIYGRNARTPEVFDNDRIIRERNEIRAYKHEPKTIDPRDGDVLNGSVLRREEKHHKEVIERHDDGNVYSRRKEVLDIPNMEINKKHGYKHEPEIIEKNIFGNSDRGRKERHAHKHDAETIDPGYNDTLNGSVLRREEKRHKERIEHQDDGNVYVRKKEALDIRNMEINQKHGYKQQPETIEKNMFVNDGQGRKERHRYKLEPENIDTRDNEDHLLRRRQETGSPRRSRDRRPEVLTLLKEENPDLSTRGISRDKEDAISSRSTGKVKEENVSRSKSTYNSSLPPPYVKLNIPPPYSKPHNASNAVKMKKESDHESEEDPHYKNDVIRLPRPKSVRRRHRHSRSSSSHDDIGSSEDVHIVKRVSSSRRKERKGLQILFDDEQYHSPRDDEEKVMDKLLLHYSKKPSAYDVEKLRKKKNRPDDHSKSPSSSSHHNDVEMVVPPTRSISLPHESGESEPKKVYARANSFQPDNQAKHVHPKLPDYDDLAARFAALRGR